MTFPTIQNSFVSGELSPSFFGRTDKAQFRNGASTMRNFFVDYRGGGKSRAGYAFVGMCKQAAPNAGGTPTTNPPRDINFQASINTGYALEFGDQYMRVKFQGAYVTEAAQNVSNITNGNPGTITIPGHGWNNGDWVYAQDITGMTEFNNLTWIVQNKTANTFILTDLFGNPVDTTNFPAYTGGGTFSRIYTVVSPYAAVDLPYLKFTQSANVMNLTCVNQQTRTEYPPYNLQRNGPANWAFTQVSFNTAISPPTGTGGSVVSSTTPDTWYSYVVTAVDAQGNESIASAAIDLYNNNISINAGSNKVTWATRAGATQYNIFKAIPIYTGAAAADPGFIGVQYGYVGTSFGLAFTDTNITADFTRTPPQHNDPFARGAIPALTVTAAGAGYAQNTTSVSINTSTGSGFSATPIIVGGALAGFIINDEGQNYQPGDTVTITGAGAGATATLTLGPQTGTYPGTPQYFQQRLVYANSINQPDTYDMSQPGLYSNFDSSIPLIDSDAINGTPWGQQINGIQFMVPTISGLLMFTGNGVWLVNGGNSLAITPSNQNAQAQAQIGCSALVPPLYLNLHILYVQAKNSIVRDVAFNFLYNVFQGNDITVFSNHLFSNFTIVQWAYAEEPFKVVWAVRNDGIMLSLTYIKEQEVQGWARHDTNGLFVGVCCVIEPPVNQDVSYAQQPPTDAIYVIVKRYIQAYGVWVYYSERANNRLWQNVEDCFCVDSGLSYPLNFPNATLTPAAAEGTSNISDTNIINGGSGYSSPTAVATDTTGSGIGATFHVTQTGGVITAVTPLTQGEGYVPGQTTIVISDPTGTGANIQPIITNNVNFTASSAVFNSGMVGDVIRVGGGKATITAYVSPVQVTANITQPISAIIPNDPHEMPVPAQAGIWSIGTPVQIVRGLNHLEGMEVSILADGGVVPKQIVTNGSVTLQNPASAIVVGLPYTCQLQTTYLDPQTQNTTQGKRKSIPYVTMRLEQTRGIQAGTNQPDQSKQPNFTSVPWENMVESKDRNGLLVDAGSAVPLFTGDQQIDVPGDWDSNGQVAFQQIYPLPAGILGVITDYSLGDPSE